MIMRRLFVAMLLVMLCLAEGVAEAEGGAAQTEMVLTGDELDRHPIEAGMLVEIVYGEGARHGFSGAWEKLVVVRGVVERVDWERRQLVVAQEEDEAKETVAVDRIQTMTVIGRAELVDSLTIKKKHRSFGIKNKGLRILAKAATGTGTGLFFTVISTERLGGEIGSDLLGLFIGYSVGFPLGVTLIDPYDSLAGTLMGSILGVLGIWAIALPADDSLGSILIIGPIIGSLYMSELSRKPPQARRVSFGLAPALNGGFSASAKLRF